MASHKIFTETITIPSGTTGSATVAVTKARPTGNVVASPVSGYVIQAGAISGQNITFSLYVTGAAAGDALEANATATTAALSTVVTYEGF